MVPRRRVSLLPIALLTVCLALTASAAAVPARLGDGEFWRLVTESSEPEGYFRSDNLLSNEPGFQSVVPELARTVGPGGVYLGVGPEQNFTYIAATRPAMAFIVDVRRGNLDLHLMYKALFELSADRADFVARLFARRRPPGLGVRSSAAEIFRAVSAQPSSAVLRAEHLQAIQDLLVRKRRLPLAGEHLEGIAYVYDAFVTYGPGLQYSSTSSFGGSFQPTYAELMTATDRVGVAHGYLASESSFRFLKELQARNLLVPVVGNFGGPKALRAVGAYLKARGATVSAFYLSNVEQYLRQDGIWQTFCGNVVALPLDGASTFIRSVRRPGDGGPGFGLASELGNMLRDTERCRS